MLLRILACAVGMWFLIYEGAHTSDIHRFALSTLWGALIGIGWCWWTQTFLWDAEKQDFTRRPPAIIAIITMPLVVLSLYIGIWVFDLRDFVPWSSYIVVSAFMEVLLYTLYQEYRPRHRR